MLEGSPVNVSHFFSPELIRYIRELIHLGFTNHAIAQLCQESITIKLIEAHFELDLTVPAQKAINETALVLTETKVHNIRGLARSIPLFSTQTIMERMGIHPSLERTVRAYVAVARRTQT